MATTEPRLAPLFAQLGFVAVAARFVYAFVSVTKEGETRRVCSAPCYLRPDYMGADRRDQHHGLAAIRRFQSAEVARRSHGASVRGGTAARHCCTRGVPIARSTLGTA